MPVPSCLPEAFARLAWGGAGHSHRESSKRSPLWAGCGARHQGALWQGAAVLLEDAYMPTPLQHLLGSCQATVQVSPLLTIGQGEVLLFLTYYFMGFGLFF